MNETQRRSGIELRDLGYFAAIVQHGRLGQAATALGVAQPTLSHAIARLEQAVRAPLWDRSGGRRRLLQLTPVGEVLLRRAEKALAEMQAIDDDLAALAGLSHGQLQLGCIPTLMASLLPRLLAQLRSEHPQLAIQVQTVRSEQVLEALREHAIDGALVAGDAAADSPWPSEACGHQRFVAVMRRDHPLAKRRRLSMAQLADEALLLVPVATITGRLLQNCCRRAGFALQPALTLDSPEGLRELVRAGGGISVLPAGYVSASDPDLHCAELADPTPARPISLVHRGLAGRPALQALLDLVQSEIG